MRHQTVIKRVRRNTGTASLVKLNPPRREAFSRVDLCVALGTVFVLGTLFLCAQIGLDARTRTQNMV